jgi:alkanesulfonate monooxygenase SsuD/methylene tetrahydromethanopterin reductase-like flavin-dependent oxidoreductase (luciferase family)
MELGVFTFGDLRADPVTGQPANTHSRFARLLEFAKTADQAGLDVLALGEHHRQDFVLSAPEVVLGAMASLTSRIRLSTSVTVLSTQDPVRVFQQFATLDQVSGGRAEVMAGRGAFVESFPLFGYDLNDYEELFDEKIQLLMQLRESQIVTWQGRLRPSLDNVGVYPRSYQDKLPVWIGVGGTPQSAARAGAIGAPMFMPSFQGARLVELYRAAGAAAGHDPAGMRTASGGHVFVGRTSQDAKDAYFPYYADYLSQAPQFAGGMTRAEFDQRVERRMMVGSPQEIIDRILDHHQLLGIDRFLAQIEVGGMPESMVNESLELYATEVAPVVRRETAVKVSA